MGLGNKLVEFSLMQPIFSWVERAYPREGCGLVLEDSAGQLRVEQCENLADRYHDLDPDQYPRTSETFYVIDPKKFLEADRRGDDIRIVFHSHVDRGDYFSDEDKRAATMPAPDDASTERVPSHPGTDYMVVSVRQARGREATIFTFSPAEGDFVASVKIRRENGAFEVSEF